MTAELKLVAQPVGKTADGCREPILISCGYECSVAPDVTATRFPGCGLFSIPQDKLLPEQGRGRVATPDR